MTATYAFVWGSIIIAIGAVYAACAWFGVGFFFRFTRARRDARWLGHEGARKLYIFVGIGMVLMGLLFWVYAAFRAGTEQRAKQIHREIFSENVKAPPPAKKPAMDYQMLADPAKLAGGYWFRPRTIFSDHSTANSTEEGQNRTEYIWRHPDDANQFVAVIITEGRDDSAVLNPGGKRFNTDRGNFINERAKLNFERLTMLRSATAGAEGITNYDGLVTFGRDAMCLSDRSYCGLYRAGYDSGRLIELIGLDKTKTTGNLRASFRSLDRTNVVVPAKPPIGNPAD